MRDCWFNCCSGTSVLLIRTLGLSAALLKTIPFLSALSDNKRIRSIHLLQRLSSTVVRPAVKAALAGAQLLCFRADPKTVTIKGLLLACTFAFRLLRF